ncbi:MAG: xanthine dehydrogenase family protein molybdopterin-binding subunit [Chloroflexi bacterium]|nr:xanthine dehydrogenase family protein molybdopterin-binding subunit [Chloroflexota bacterium]
MTTSGDRGTATPGLYKVIGTRPIRHDGVDKVTGVARFGADIDLPGMLHGKLLRSPHAHARIRSIDTSKAEALPGVKAVATARDFSIVREQSLDFSQAMRPSRITAEVILAHERVMYVGHAVAAVAAVSPHIAEEAARLIEVDYEVLPAILSIEDALKEGAPILYEDMTTHSQGDSSSRGSNTGVKSNIASHIQLKRGNLEQGFREADVIVERELFTQTVHQGYIEPFACTASWTPDECVTVWTTTQGIFAVRAGTAEIMGLPESSVKVIPMEVGGGFGGKGPFYLEPVAAVLSKKTGHPVKMVMTRKEVFEGTGPGSASHMRVKMGAGRSGRITAAQFYLAYEAGAFPGSSVGGGATTGLGSYKIDNLLVDGYDVVVNKQKAQAYRAPGQQQASFAIETVIDELAEKLGMDPLEFRLNNVVQEGDRMPNGVPYPRIGCKEIEEAMKAHPHYSAPLEGPNRGRGIAVAFRLQGGQGASATINVNSNGTISLITGAMDLSGTRTTVAMQAAEVLGLSMDDVVSTVADTDSVGFSAGSHGSRITFDAGLAAISAAEEVKRQMSARAALLWEVQQEDVEFKDGVFMCARNSADRITFKELARQLGNTGGPITCSVYAPTTGVGPIFAGNIVDVAVDPETGKVDILRFTTFLDAGRAVHPGFVEGQMQGATAQGIGWALNEEFFYTENGTVANSSFLDYRMPTSLDLPMIDTVIIEVPNPRHPFGLRGVGEVPAVPPLAAVANAIYHAVGVRMTRLPMSPGSILKALEAVNPQG